MPIKAVVKPYYKRVIALRQDLLPRAQERADELKQNLNQFINLCVEGCLDAVDGTGPYEIPIVQVLRTLHGKTFLTSKAVMALVGALVPEAYDLDKHQQRFWLELINKHEGPLNSSMIKTYFNLAADMNAERIAHEKRRAKLSATNPQK